LISLKKLPNGFEYIDIKNNSAEAKIALNGAHVFHYKRVGEEPVLWLSEKTEFEEGTSIRGGIPICWPWFGINEDKNLPAHGFARNSKFKIIKQDEINKDMSSVTFKLENKEYELSLHVEVGAKLKLELKTTNIDTKPFKITQAFHTYFNVSDILHVEIDGLNNKPYLDALTMKQEKQNGSITFKEEVDRVYQEVDTTIVLKDANRTLHVENFGSSSAVIWNPWIDKCKRMSLAKNDMREDAYKEFVCIESANAFDDFIVLEPNESHTLKAIIY